MDIFLMTLSVIGVLLLAVGECLKFRKGIYNPYIFGREEASNHKRRPLFLFLIFLLAWLPPIWIQDPDYKKISYTIIITLIFIVLNILNVMFIMKPIATNTRKIVTQTMIFDAVMVGVLILFHSWN